MEERGIRTDSLDTYVPNVSEQGPCAGRLFIPEGTPRRRVDVSRGTFTILSRDPSFQETIKNPGETADFLKRTMLEQNGIGINPQDFVRSWQPWGGITAFVCQAPMANLAARGGPKA